MVDGRDGVPGRRVLVTGAAGGLGAALTAAFAEQGDRVLATDLADALDAAGPPDGAVAVLPLDVTSASDWGAATAWVEEHWGGLDVLVNNAGIAGGGRLDVATLEEWRRLTEVNLFGVVRGTAAVTPLLKRQGSGQVVNVASLAGLVHPAGMASYNAVKAAVVALTETTGHELAGYGIRAMAVCPSYFRTGLLERMQGADEVVGALVGRLVAESPVSAAQVAAEVLAGIDDGVELLLPDEAARAAYALKTTDRRAYDARMRRQAAHLQRLADACPRGSG